MVMALLDIHMGCCVLCVYVMYICLCLWIFPDCISPARLIHPRVHVFLCILCSSIYIYDVPDIFTYGCDVI